MIPEHLKFGGGASETVLHPAVLVAMLLTAILLFVLPRKYRVVPLLSMCFLVPLGQQVLVGGVHFHVLRILILAGCVRMMTEKRGSWDQLDKLFAVWAVCRSVAFVLLFQDSGAVVNQAAFLLDALGGFFLLRYLIQDQEDIQRTIKTLAVVAAVLAVCMLNERYNSRNVFGYLGGVRLVPEVRDGSIRAQGPFAHALLAGSFGSTLLPLFVWLWSNRGARLVAAAGIMASAIITLTSASSTPTMALAAGILGMCLWVIRDYLSILRWGCAAVVAVLAVAMKAPVWFLIARIDLVGGSSGYHRALLIDQFIRHFFDWWLVGTNSNSTWGWDMWDTCNQYVTEGETGGLVTFVCFIGLIWISFRRFGQARRAVRGDRKQEWFYWILGTTLFAHTIAFLGIVYFDQTRMIWYAFLAIGIAATAPVLAARATPARIEDAEATCGQSALASPSWDAAPENPWLSPVDTRSQFSTN